MRLRFSLPGLWFFGFYCTKHIAYWQVLWCFVQLRRSWWWWSRTSWGFYFWYLSCLLALLLGWWDLSYCLAFCFEINKSGVLSCVWSVQMLMTSIVGGPFWKEELFWLFLCFIWRVSYFFLFQFLYLCANEHATCLKIVICTLFEGIVLFPEATLPLRVIQPRFKAAVELAMKQDEAPCTIGVVCFNF